MNYDDKNTSFGPDSLAKTRASTTNDGVVSAASPIGVFDSGLGGLTVLKALREAMPAESFVYLGDVARLPYGNKSAGVVSAYSRDCMQFLERHGVKLVVVACNTATALSAVALQQESDIPVVGVIEAGVRAALAATKNRRVLVLATDSTVRNEAYLREFNNQGFDGEVRQIACPLLVPLAEEGWWDREITAQVIDQYVDRVSGFDYDTLVLGCTHYPLLEPAFRKVLRDEVALVHGGTVLAEQVQQILREKKLEASGSSGEALYFATDSVSSNLPLLKFSGSLGTVSFQTVSL